MAENEIATAEPAAPENPLRVLGTAIAAAAGGAVTEAQFRSFVDEQVTPRFPDGLTLLTGIGQFRDAGGATLVEGANVLILLYPHGSARADRQIDAIRNDYRRRFEQQSVLRADSVSCVSF